MITRPGFGLSMFLAVLLVGFPAFAFDDPLGSTTIRDAFFCRRRIQGQGARRSGLGRGRPPGIHAHPA
jgi:hypothetical protein